MSETIVYYDIAAVVIMILVMAAISVRHTARARTYRSYVALMSIITLTSLVEMCAVLYDSYVYGLFAEGGAGIRTLAATAPQELLHTAYFALRTLNAPCYFMFIAVITDTLHRFSNSNLRRLVMWAPLALALAVIATNPLHHGIYASGSDISAAGRGPLVWTVYLTALYYSVLGIALLLRWRPVLSTDKFHALIALYPLNLFAVLLQYFNPFMRIEMFFTSIAFMLVSTFVMRPEHEIDAFTNTLSFQAFEEMARHAFQTEKPLCLVFIDIANKDRLRELSGQNAFRNIVRAVSVQTSGYLQANDELYYLRNGLFCISAHNTDVLASLAIAQRSSREGREAAKSLPEQAMAAQLRTCIVQTPQDVQSLEVLQTFIRRIAHLVPQPCVTTYEELSHQAGFDLAMNLADITSHAITEQRFEVYYQPIWSVADRRFHSAEALVRLKDPTYGFVSPGLFIPEAEQSGAILDIGHITLEHIFRFLGEVDFEATGLEYVEVNLSVDQCVQPALAHEVQGLMAQHHVSGDRINLEITETSSSYQQDAIEANVRALAKAGLTFALDDFGSGYSSLSRMLALPFDLVKIDRSLVTNMGEPHTHVVLANTIATMKSIGKKVLAEGVETADQARQVVEMGVDYIQGYLYAHPMPQDEFEAFLMAHNG